MPDSELIHTRMLRNMRRIFTSRANIQDDVITQDSHNEDIHIWVDNPLLMQLPCYVEPISGNSGEQRLPGSTLVTGLWNCIIAGYHTNITKLQQITIDDIAYNIKDVSVESTNTITALVLEKVSK